jgi:hypothetical protein
MQSYEKIMKPPNILLKKITKEKKYVKNGKMLAYVKKMSYFCGVKKHT